jgi:hypothetical protein
MTTDIDALCKRVDDLCLEIDEAAALHKARHTRRTTIDEHFSDDPAVGSDDDYEDVSNPSADADDDSDGADPGDDDEDDGISKLGAGRDVVYPHAEEAGYQQQHSLADRPGSLKHTTHSSTRHKFLSMVDKAKREQGLGAPQALAYVRQQMPELYRSYQEFDNSERTAKRAPDLVELEMRKGCSREVAAQRVAQQWGFRAFDQSTSIRKRADLTYEFQSRVDEIMRKDRVDACEGTRRARLEDEALFAAMQRAG